MACNQNKDACSWRYWDKDYTIEKRERTILHRGGEDGFARIGRRIGIKRIGIKVHIGVVVTVSIRHAIVVGLCGEGRTQRIDWREGSGIRNRGEGRRVRGWDGGAIEGCGGSGSQGGIGGGHGEITFYGSRRRRVLRGGITRRRSRCVMRGIRFGLFLWRFLREGLCFFLFRSRCRRRRSLRSGGGGVLLFFGLNTGVGFDCLEIEQKNSSYCIDGLFLCRGGRRVGMFLSF